MRTTRLAAIAALSSLALAGCDWDLFGNEPGTNCGGQRTASASATVNDSTGTVAAVALATLSETLAPGDTVAGNGWMNVLVQGPPSGGSGPLAGRLTRVRVTDPRGGTLVDQAIQPGQGQGFGNILVQTGGSFYGGAAAQARRDLVAGGLRVQLTATNPAQVVSGALVVTDDRGWQPILCY